jgi:hypothetical protein
VDWHSGRDSRVPHRVYTDEALYRRELERLFYKGHWCYVGLEAEVPNHCDYKRTFVGERQVIMVREADGSKQPRFFRKLIFKGHDASHVIFAMASKSIGLHT